MKDVAAIRAQMVGNCSLCSAEPAPVADNSRRDREPCAERHRPYIPIPVPAHQCRGIPSLLVIRQCLGNMEFFSVKGICSYSYIPFTLYPHRPSSLPLFLFRNMSSLPAPTPLVVCRIRSEPVPVAADDVAPGELYVVAVQGPVCRGGVVARLSPCPRLAAKLSVRLSHCHEPLNHAGRGFSRHHRRGAGGRNNARRRLTSCPVVHQYYFLLLKRTSLVPIRFRLYRHPDR